MAHCRNRIILAAVVFTLVAFSPFAQAFNVPVTYTGDGGVVGFWLMNEGAPLLLPLGENAGAWERADPLVLNLDSGHTYQLIWQVINYGDKSDPWGNAYNPGSFLAEIASNPLISGNLLSSNAWDVALTRGNLTPPTDFNTLTWFPATEYGANEYYNSPADNIWNRLLYGSVPGISMSAKWIWWEENFADAGAPLGEDSVYIRTTITTVPIPSTLLLLGSGLVGLIGLRRKFKK